MAQTESTAHAQHRGTPALKRAAARLAGGLQSSRLQYLVLAIFSDLQVLAVASGLYGSFDGGSILLAVFFGVVGLVAVSRIFAETAAVASDIEARRS
jgi:hypothetical protein